MAWPRFLVEELADRGCVIVVGSGVSSSCIAPDPSTPPSWTGLLGCLRELVHDAVVHEEITSLLDSGKLLETAQVIQDSTLGEDRERVIKRLLEKEFVPSDWVSIIRDLDQNVVITTNYDCILEDTYRREGSRVHIHKDMEVVKVLRSPELLIYKVHGCIRRDPGSLVLALSDYHRMRASYPHCLRLLEAIFTTHTALFIGYSLGDSDIQMVLQNVGIAFPSAQPHILFASSSMHDSVKNAMQSAFNLRFVTYPSGDHVEGLRMFRSLFEDVQSLRASRIGAI